MEGLFTALTHAVEGAPSIALAAAFGWGLASILLSPCHLASIPLIVGFISGQGRMPVRRATAIAALFSLGILATIAALGAATKNLSLYRPLGRHCITTAAAGRMLGDVGPFGNYLVAAVFFLVGLHLLDVVHVPGLTVTPRGGARRGMWAALMLGLTFGIALGPCTFAYLAPMLAVTFTLAEARAAYGVLLLLAYGVGHCSIIVLAGASSEWGQRYLNWQERSGGALALSRVCGVLVLFGGLYLLYTAR